LKHRWPRISTQLDRDGEAVGGTLTLRPEKNLIVELA
jgi:hypothetical protein